MLPPWYYASAQCCCMSYCLSWLVIECGDESNVDAKKCCFNPFTHVVHLMHLSNYCVFRAFLIIVARPRWLLRIVVVHTQCSKLFKGMGCTVLPIVRIVHNKEPLKSFEIRVGHSPGFGLNSVEILQWFCRKRRQAIFTHTIPNHCGD